MDKGTVVRFRRKEEVIDPLADLLRRGARGLTGRAVAEEFEVLLERHAKLRDGQGRQAVVRNGYLPSREIVTGIGPVSVRMPKARDRLGEGLRFVDLPLSSRGLVRLRGERDASLPTILARLMIIGG